MWYEHDSICVHIDSECILSHRHTSSLKASVAQLFASISKYKSVTVCLHACVSVCGSRTEHCIGRCTARAALSNRAMDTANRHCKDQLAKSQMM